METTSLYDLPKDMLIKLITTLQDAKNLDNKQLEKNIKSSMEEMEKRKFSKLKEIFLQRSEFKDYFSLANSIQVVRLRRMKESSKFRLEIFFEDGSGIKAYVEEQTYYATIFNTKGEDICGVVGNEFVSWKGEHYESGNAKYSIYIQFFRDVASYAFNDVYEYLDPLTEIDDC
jgi:hypothetical protein